MTESMWCQVCRGWYEGMPAHHPDLQVPCCVACCAPAELARQRREWPALREAGRHRCGRAVQVRSGGRHLCPGCGYLDVPCNR